MNTLTRSIRAWHGGQLVIAWIGVAIAMIAVVGSYFGLLGIVGHNDWPNDERRACLQPASRPVYPSPGAEVSLRMIRLAQKVAGQNPDVSQDEAMVQLGFSGPLAAANRFAEGAFSGFSGVPTPSTDTTRMLADLQRFHVYPDSLDTVVQNAYLGARGLRLDRDCVSAHYKAIDRRISVLGWATVLLLGLLPLLGLSMTWVWFGGRTPRPSSK